jgi:hypothetical protein
MKPLIDQTVKEGKDKKVVFECIFSKPNGKPKWYLKKDVGSKSSFLFL